MARKGVCCVVEGDCVAAANFEEAGYVGECWRCGQDVCVKCSRMRIQKETHLRKRICNNCIEEDGRRKEAQP